MVYNNWFWLCRCKSIWFQSIQFTPRNRTIIRISWSLDWVASWTFWGRRLDGSATNDCWALLSWTTHATKCWNPITVCWLWRMERMGCRSLQQRWGTGSLRRSREIPLKQIFDWQCSQSPSTPNLWLHKSRCSSWPSSQTHWADCSWAWLAS